MDASNWSGPFTDAQMAELKAAGVVGVIVQAITGLDGISDTAQQCACVVRNGLKLAGYVWCFPHESDQSIQSRLALFDGFTLVSLWVDLEQAGLTRNDVDRLLALCDSYANGLTGIYTAKYVFDRAGWSDQAYWANRPLWDANYDGIPDPSVDFVPFGGWSRCVLKQYLGTSSIGSLHEIDLDALAVA